MNDDSSSTDGRIPDSPASTASRLPGWTAGRGPPPTASIEGRRARTSFRSTLRRPPSRAPCTLGHTSATPISDIVARYQRMTARRSSIQWAGRTTGCPPSAGSRTLRGSLRPVTPYDDANFAPPEKPGDKKLSISPQELRRNSVTVSPRPTEEVFKNLWRAPARRVEVSTGVSSTRPSRTTPRRSPQRAFLAMLGRGEVYSSVGARPSGTSTFELPSPRPSSRTANVQRHYHRARLFEGRRSGAVEIEHHPTRTARELRRTRGAPERRALPVALWHQRAYALFHVEVPVLGARTRRPEKGSGIAMICTFGDTTDVTWWHELSLPTRAQLIGRLTDAPPL